MQALRDAPSLPASLELFWDQFGKAYLEQSHAYMVLNRDVYGCYPVTMENFSSDFNATLAAVLTTWGVRKEVVGELVGRVAAKSDMNFGAKTEEQRKADPHVTANKFSKGLVKEVVAGLQAMPEVAALVQAHRAELGYAAA
jgi:hypothetical protein